MTATGNQFARTPTSARKAAGFTLVELLIALALTALLLRLILPLFAAARSDNVGGVTGEGESLQAWRTILRTDFARLVSPVKSGLPVVQVKSSGEGGLQQLVLQTLSPPGVGSRGPVEVTYALEAENDGQGVAGLALVRSGRGWHDGQRTRHVLLRDLVGWEIRTQSEARTRTTDEASHEIADASVLQVTVRRGNGTDANAEFWIVTGIDLGETASR